MRMLRLCGLAALVAVAGCASTPAVDAFNAWERPTQTAVLVEADGAHCQVVNGYLIPGEPSPRWPSNTPNNTYTIPTGRVTLTAGYYQKRNSGGGPGFQVTLTKPYTGVPKTIVFDAEPGHTYVFETKTDWLMPVFSTEIKADAWDVRVVDKASKTVVAKTHDRDTKPTTRPTTE